MGTLVPAPSRCQPRADSPEGSSLDLGLWTNLSCQRAPRFRGWVWLGLELVFCVFLHLRAELPSFGRLFRLGTLGADVLTPSPALPFPELRDGHPAVPGYCLRRQPAASLPLSSTPCLQGLFPNSCSNHTPRSARSPSPSSLLPPAGVGLEKKANLTAAPLSWLVTGPCPRILVCV